MNKLDMKCESVVKNERDTSVILRTEDKKTRATVVNAPFEMEPGKTYSVTVAESVEG